MTLTLVVVALQSAENLNLNYLEINNLLIASFIFQHHIFDFDSLIGAATTSLLLLCLFYQMGEQKKAT